MNKKLSATILTAAALTLVGCESNPYTGEHRRTATGATVGAGAGALLGMGVSGSSDRGQGALIGAAVGATVGGLIGRQMDQQEAELRQQMQGTGVDVSREGDTIRLTAPGSITFQTSSAQLAPQFSATLNQIATSVNNYQGTVVLVEGHTDSTGPLDYNMRLSEQRATSVANYLMQRGVEGSRISLQGYGPNRPIADNTTSSGRQTNRRVEVLIVPQTQ